MGVDYGESQTIDMGVVAGDDLASDLTDDLRARVKSELDPGERLQWAGKSYPPVPPLSPDQWVGVAATPALFAFATGCFANALGHLGTPIKDILYFGLLGSLAGGFVAIMTLYGWSKRRHERRRLSNLYSAVTDRRAIIWVLEAKDDAVRMISVMKGQIDGAVRVERPDGSGTIELSCSVYVGHWDLHPFGFRHVRDVRRVEQVVRNNLISEAMDKQADRNPSESMEE